MVFVFIRKECTTGRESLWRLLLSCALYDGLRIDVARSLVHPVIAAALSAARAHGKVSHKVLAMLMA